ncbi:MAG TPA: transporter [Porphyromonadaceae bacterium]|jgi:outer membrane protein TolC|uniref:TolC family protein n=1 Tax=Limibacterium fermenti TaxID=3229863 RepID=UPI000E7DC72D|nr:transporter [Porphyromonadaceae bacterium]
MKDFFLIVSFLWLVCLPFPLRAQSVLTLDTCRQLAVKNYPLIQQYGLIDKIEQKTLSTIGKSYLPQISLGAQVSYQSDVTEISLDLPSELASVFEFPTLNKDQYRANLEAIQIIWDGGRIASQKNIAKAVNDVQRQEIKLSLYAVKAQVDKLFFGILALDEQLKVLDLVKNELEENRKTVQSHITNGLATQTDLDLVDVEVLNLEQNRMEQKSIRQSMTHILELLIHTNIENDTKFIKPSEEPVTQGVLSRPELRSFDLNNTLYKRQYQVVLSKNRPNIGLFAQGGYGRPGLNILENKFNFYAVGGIRLTWNLSNLYSKKNELQTIQEKKEMLDVQRETFLFNTGLELVKQYGEIRKLKEMVKKDDEIIALRNRIKQVGESKYKNGIYRLTDLLRDITSENQARQIRSLHEIQYLMSIQNYKHIQGAEK